MIERFGRVLEPEAIRQLARSDAAALAPHAVFRMLRELEPPSADEGFASVEQVPFVREYPEAAAANSFIALHADPSLKLLRDTPEATPMLVYA